METEQSFKISLFYFETGESYLRHPRGPTFSNEFSSFYSSWPSLTNGPVESGMSAKTPAALSPMIRSLLRLWCHESTRTYSDRLLTEDQRYWFSSLLHETVEEIFCKTASDLGSEVFSVERSVMQNSQGT